jgi:bacterioferritin-associated ferredoxin
MHPDDELCLCFHVTWRKVINFARIHRIRRASQLSGCQGAGTGCGWCRRQLERIATRIAEDPPDPSELDNWLQRHSPARDAYARGRQQYLASGKGKPPSGSEEKVGEPPQDHPNSGPSQ